MQKNYYRLVLLTLSILFFASKNLAEAADACAGKEHCAVIYLAPWCPYCRNEIPEVRKFLEKASKGKIGVQVYIGKDKAKANAKMAKEVGAATLDNDLAISDKYDVSSVPFFLVLDKQGKIILRNEAAHHWMKENLN